MIEEALMELDESGADSSSKSSGSKSKKKKNRSKSKKKKNLSVSSSDIQSPTSADPLMSVKIDSTLIQDLCDKFDKDSINNTENDSFNSSEKTIKADDIELEQSSLELDEP